MKKRVLFVCNNLNHGGIPRALVNLLREISGTCQAELLLFEPSGDYLSELPEDVKLVPSEGLLFLLGIPQEELKKKSRIMALRRAFFVGFSRIFGNSWPRQRVFATAPRLTGYDVAVAFAQDNSDKAFAIGCNAFVLDRVDAKLKATFVHCDFENYGGNTPGNRAVYHKFDRIACVSEGCRGAFLRVMPELAEKTVVVENCTDYAEVVRKAGLETEPWKSMPVENGERAWNIVSVSRINPEKALLRALEALQPVLHEQKKVRWHIVGDGPERSLLETAIKNAGLERQVILYGMQANPYPYMKAADIFFLPSIHEAAPMVFEEARALGTPILTTDTLSAQSMVAERGSGFVCQNSMEGIRAEFIRFIEHPESVEDVKRSMRAWPLDNQKSVRQWETLIG